MLNRKQKEEIVSALSGALQAEKTALLFDYKGVSTKNFEKLRNEIRKQGGAIQVVRKTLFRRALAAAGIAELPEAMLSGQIAVVYGFPDVVGAAKSLALFRKELEVAGGTEIAFTIRGGYLGERMLEAGDVRALAALPGRQELLAQVVGTIAAPLRGLVSILSGPQRAFTQIISQLAQRG